MVSFDCDVLFAKPHRRYIFIICFILLGIFTVGYLRPTPTIVNITPSQEVDPFDSQFYVRGPPTDSFRDNLRPRVKYITSWIESAGWTIDVITYMNLIYLGILTNRVPVIGPFPASIYNFGMDNPHIDFGEVFDIPRLRKLMGRPLLEWHEVKNSSSHVMDELFCWGVWEALQDRDTFPRAGRLPDLLNLDIGYSKMPSWIKLKFPADEHDPGPLTSFSALAMFGFPEHQKKYGRGTRGTPHSHALLFAEEQMLCYDNLYHVCSYKPHEIVYDYNPAWVLVGQYMHWTPRIETLADSYVRRAFETHYSEPTPPWITVHVRHSDFVDSCGTVPVGDCFPSISVIKRRVNQVKQQLLEQKRVIVTHVIMTSDERNTTWWEKVKDEGWYKIDHSRTVEQHGAWYPLLIDAAIQSGGAGFVGSAYSTVSILASRRVQSWQDGVVRLAKWGTPDADNL